MTGLRFYAKQGARGPGGRRILLIVAAAAVVSGSLIGVAGPAGATGANGVVRTQSLGQAGTPHITTGAVTLSTRTHPSMAGSAAATRRHTTSYRVQPDVVRRAQGAKRKPGATLAIPTVNCTTASAGCDAISTSNGGAITQPHALNATANGNIYGFDIEPPDQQLCAGNGYVMEGINIGEIQVFNANVHPVSGITSLDSLMGLTARGWSSGGDVTCLYDPDNGGHWFIIEIVSTNSEASGGPFTGCFAGVKNHCREGLAVSTTNNPLATSWNVYFLNPNKLSPTDQGAGYLLNDFAKLGNTRDALLVSYDEFILNPKLIPPCPAFGCVSFNGAQQLAIQKTALELGYNSANLVHENMGTDPFIQPPDGNCANGSTAGVTCWGPVIPASSPAGEFNNNYGGSGFMTATLDFNSFAFGVPNGDNRVAVFFWTGLKYLDSFNCNACQLISFGGQLFTGVETYIDGELNCPVNASNPSCSLAPQRLGTLDLGTYCGEPVLGNPPIASVPKCPEEGLATNGDTVYEASYAAGQIWFATHTYINQQFTTGNENSHRRRVLGGRHQPVHRRPAAAHPHEPGLRCRGARGSRVPHTGRWHRQRRWPDVVHAVGQRRSHSCRRRRILPEQRVRTRDGDFRRPRGQQHLHRRRGQGAAGRLQRVSGPAWRYPPALG